MQWTQCWSVGVFQHNCPLEFLPMYPTVGHNINERVRLLVVFTVGIIHGLCKSGWHFPESSFKGTLHYIFALPVAASVGLSPSLRERFAAFPATGLAHLQFVTPLGNSSSPPGTNSVFPCFCKHKKGAVRPYKRSRRGFFFFLLDSWSPGQDPPTPPELPLIRLIPGAVITPGPPSLNKVLSARSLHVSS